MKRYYVNKNAQPNGDHEVHQEGCSYLPAEANRRYLGTFASCHEAVRAAAQHYNQVNGCYYCCPECHTGQAPRTGKDRGRARRGREAHGSLSQGKRGRSPESPAPAWTL